MTDTTKTTSSTKASYWNQSILPNKEWIGMVSGLAIGIIGYFVGAHYIAQSFGSTIQHASICAGILVLAISLYFKIDAWQSDTVAQTPFPIEGKDSKLVTEIKKYLNEVSKNPSIALDSRKLNVFFNSAYHQDDAQAFELIMKKQNYHLDDVFIKQLINEERFKIFHVICDKYSDALKLHTVMMFETILQNDKNFNQFINSLKILESRFPDQIKSACEKFEYKDLLKVLSTSFPFAYFLIENGINIEDRYIEPLFTTIRTLQNEKNGPEILNCLNVLSKRFPTPMKEAIAQLDPEDLMIQMKYPKMAAFLIDKGIDLRKRCKSGQSLLFTALEKSYEQNPENFQLLGMLIDAGIDCTERDSDGNTLLHHCFMNQNGLFRFLVENHGKLFSPAEAETPPERLGAFGVGIVRRPVSVPTPTFDLNARNSKGTTPLLLAIEADRWHEVRILIQMGANCEIENSAGILPFNLLLIKYRLAIRNISWDAIKILKLLFLILEKRRIPPTAFVNHLPNFRAEFDLLHKKYRFALQQGSQDSAKILGFLESIIRENGMSASDLENYYKTEAERDAKIERDNNSKLVVESEAEFRDFVDIILKRIYSTINEKQYQKAKEYINLLSIENLTTSGPLFQALLEKYRIAKPRSAEEQELRMILSSMLSTTDEPTTILEKDRAILDAIAASRAHTPTLPTTTFPASLSSPVMIHSSSIEDENEQLIRALEASMHTSAPAKVAASSSFTQTGRSTSPPTSASASSSSPLRNTSSSSSSSSTGRSTSPPTSASTSSSSPLRNTSSSSSSSSTGRSTSPPTSASASSSSPLRNTSSSSSSSSTGRSTSPPTSASASSSSPLRNTSSSSSSSSTGRSTSPPTSESASSSIPLRNTSSSSSSSSTAGNTGAAIPALASVRAVSSPSPSSTV